MRSGNPGRIYYGWYIVGVVFIANFMSVGTGFYSFNAFLEPLCDTYGWTRTQVNMALAIGTPVGFLCQFVYGTLVMRLGVKKLMTAGSLIGGVSFILLFQTSRLWLFYLLYALVFIGNGAYGGIVANSAVNNWFIRKRGRAQGIATSGISLSGAVLPFIAMALVLRMGMTGASVCIGLAVLAFAPLFWLVMVDWPEERGWTPDGLQVEGQAVPNNEPGALPVSNINVTGMGAVPAVKIPENQNLWPLERLIRVPAFWKLGLAYAMVMTGVVGVMSQLKPRFVDVGFSDTTAMTLMAVTALFGAAGKYSWGMLCDFINPNRVIFAIMIANGIGLMAALMADSAIATGAFVFLIGFGNKCLQF